MSYTGALVGLPFGKDKAVPRKPRDDDDQGTTFLTFGDAIGFLRGRKPEAA